MRITEDTHHVLTAVAEQKPNRNRPRPKTRLGVAAVHLVARSSTFDVASHASFPSKIPDHMQYTRTFGWPRLPHIFETLVATLEFQLKGCRPGSFKVERDHINFTLVGDEGPEIPLQVYVAPSVASRESLIGSIRAAPPAERFYFYPSMAKQRNEFIGRQTSQTKLVIRLVTWWSSKQTWSTSFSTPSDWLLELVVVHTCLHPDNVNLDLPELMDCVLCALAKIEVAKVFSWTLVVVFRGMAERLCHGNVPLVLLQD